MATAKCPSCARPLEVEDAYRDWTVRCPHCGHEFVPSAEAAREEREDDRPRRRRRRDDDDSDDREDRDERDRRDRDRDERDDRERDDEPDRVPSSVRREALAEVSAPAMWLEICGWLSAVASAGLTVLFMVLASEAANNPRANRNDEPAGLFVVIGCCAGVLGVPYGVAMAIGARKMRDLSNRGWALAASILGIAAFSLFGVLGLVHTAFGVWALVALDKPAVREVFGLPVSRRRRRRRRDYDEDDD